MDLAERFWSKVDIRSEDECWEWQTGRQPQGYGIFYFADKKNILSHRMAYLLVYGEIPEGLCICHACDNPSCCNPRHLFLGTHKDNSMDMARKGRGRKPLKPKTEKRQGKSRLGETNGMSKLTMEQAREIRRLASSGLRAREIANIFNLGKTTVRYVIKGITWKEQIQAD